jgi:CBS domain-containing protein
LAASEFEEAHGGPVPGRREEQRLGEAILEARISDLDTYPALVVPESASVGDAIRLMVDRHVGAILVVRGTRAIGIFSERDVMCRVVTGGIGLERPVMDAATPEPETLGPDDNIAFALNRMVIGGYRHIPIVDDSGAPLAILSQREIVSYIVSLLPARVLNLPPEPRLEARSEDGG